MTVYTKGSLPATAYTKAGQQIGGVGNPCVGVESDPAILVPNNVLTWTAVKTLAGKGLWAEVFNNRLVVAVRIGAIDRLALAHSLDGITWTEVTVTPVDQFQFGNFMKAYQAFRASGTLSLITSGNSSAVYETTDLTAFVKRYNQTIATALSVGGGAVVSLVGTLYLLIQDRTVYKDNGANFVAVASVPAVGGGGAVNQAAIAFDTLVVAIRGADSTDRLYSYDQVGNSWTERANIGDHIGITGLTWWADKQQLWMIAGDGRVYRMASLTTAPVQMFSSFIPVGGGMDIRAVSRNLYILTDRVYRTPDGIALVDIGLTGLTTGLDTNGFNVSSLSRIFYHPGSTRFYLVSAIGANRVWQSSVPS